MRRILNILSRNLPLLLILIAGLILRFYKLEGFTTFLGDQGRDAIILKRIITFEHFPAIGAPTSIGQVYLGPFYYYFIAPWLLLFNFDPLGPAFGVAFFSVLFLAANYFIVRELFDVKTSIISTLFLTFSYELINFSRFSWNPNLLPLFTLLTVYFFIKSIKTRKWYFFVLFGSFLSFTIQLHYLALFVIPSVAFLLASSVIPNSFRDLKNKKILRQVQNDILNIFISFVSFIFFSVPLIIFDLRHDFLNTKNFIILFQTSGTDLSAKLKNFIDSFFSLNTFSFQVSLNRYLSFSLLISITVVLISLYKNRTNLKSFIFIFLITLAGLSFYSGERHPHYFGVLFPLYYIIVAYFLAFSLDSTLGKILVVAFVSGFIFLNFQKYPYFRYPANNQITLAENVAKKIYDNVDSNKFTVTALPEKYSDSTYRYFLELWKKRPIEKDSLEKADELFLVCEKKCEPIIGNPQWDIAYFAPTKINSEWSVDGVRIYKLVR